MRTQAGLGWSAKAAILLLRTTACGSEHTVAWRGTVDVLESGVVLVSNPAVGVWDSASSWKLVEDLLVGSVEGTLTLSET